MRLRLLLALGFALVAVACQVPPSAGIDEARAVELARQRADPVDGLVEAKVLRARDVPEAASVGLPGDRLVWRISFTSSEVRQCGPAPSGQLCRVDSKTVIIDASTGEVVTSSESGSIQP